MPGTAAITLTDVSKSFRIPHERHLSLRSQVIHLLSPPRFTVLRAVDHVSFTVRKGEFFGVVGRNGSGKSTILKMLAGIYVPGGGAITVDGSLSPFIELGVGFNPELTARENVYLNGVILGLTRAEIDERFASIIAFGDLQEFVDQKVKHFSSGMQVRLAFSVAIQAESDIVLIDEVLAVGDANFQAKCLQVFRDLKKRGKTIVFVTHDMGAMQEFCDRAVVIHDGELVFEGDPREAASAYLRQTATVPIRDTQSETRSTGAAPAAVLDVWVDGQRDTKEIILEREVESYNVSVHIRFLTAVSGPVPAVILYSADGQRVTASNTKWVGLETGDFSPGDEAVFTFRFANQLEMGTYRVSAGVTSADLVGVLDWREDVVLLFCPRNFTTGAVSNPRYSASMRRI